MIKLIGLLAMIFSTSADANVCKRCDVVQPSSSRLERHQITRVIGTASHRTKLKYTQKDWESFYKLLFEESGYNSRTKNKNSTAFGLMQFLNSTWKTVGIKKTNCPYCQVEAGALYIKYRYKTPTKAYEHKRRHGWY